MGGRVFLTDFGLARHTVHGSKLTATGESLGTPDYMSPEQARGDLAALGPGADLWSLGCVCYELCAGRRPFPGSTAAEIVGRVLLEQPVPLGRVCPDAPADVARVVGACLAKRPDARYGRAAHLREDLARILGGEPPRHVLGWPRTRRRLAGAAFLLVGTVLVWSWTRSWWPGARPSDARPSASEALAARARGLRYEDPARAADLLGDALAAEPARHAWRLERGLLLWSVGRSEAARQEWARIPLDAPEGRPARLYRGLEACFRWEDERFHAAESVPDLEPLAVGADPAARLARGALCFARNDAPGLVEALRGMAGWEAALLRAFPHLSEATGDAAEGVREYTAALAVGPPFAWAYVNRGYLRTRLGDHAGAEADYSTALRLAPRFLRALRNRVNARRDLGNLDGARADADALVAASPEDATSHYARARIRSDAGDLAGAVAAFGEAIRLQPDYPEVLTDRAGVLLRHARYAEVVADCTAALATRRRFADAPLAHAHRADARAALADDRGAAEDYAIALRSRPRESGWRLRRGDACLKLGLFAEARDDFTVALEVAPGLVRAWRGRAVARVELGDFAGAVADYTAAVRLAPDADELMLVRGLARQRAGDPAGAITDLTAWLATHPTDVVALQVRAAAWAMQRNLVEAERDLSALLAIRADGASDWVARAQCRAARGDRAGAAADMDEAARRAPEDPVVRRARGHFREESGDYAGAVEDFSAVLAREPGDASALAGRGTCRIELGDLPGARSDLEAAIRADPRHAVAHLNLGALLLGGADDTGAAPHFREFLRLAPPTHPFVGQARAWLARCEAAGDGR